MRSLLTIFLLLYLGVASAESPQSFERAKDVARTIYQGHQTTFYCGCSYTLEGKKGTPVLESCGYEVRKDEKRATRIEWEHVVPAWELGHNLECWEEGTRKANTTGRKYCLKVNPVFKAMYFNLHNLVPAVDQVNKSRLNYSFTVFDENSNCKKEARNYGACEIKISNECDLVEPPPHTRGAIARIYLYMWEEYKFELAKEQKDMFKLWDETYPVTEWECERDRLIAVEQGERNPKVQVPCTKAGL